MLSFKLTFSLSSLIKRLFSSLSLSPIGWCHLHIWAYSYFSQQSWFQILLHPARHFTWCAGWQYTTLTYSFLDLEPVCCSMSSSNCCFLICIQISQEAGKLVWYSHLFKNFPQFFVIHTVKGFGVVNKADVGVFLKLSCFFNDPMEVEEYTTIFSNRMKLESHILKHQALTLFFKGQGTETVQKARNNATTIQVRK